MKRITIGITLIIFSLFLVLSKLNFIVTLQISEDSYGEGLPQLQVFQPSLLLLKVEVTNLH